MLRAAPHRAERLYLAIDQGGHASRALIFDGAGRLRAAAAREIAAARPAPGQVEYDAEALVESVRGAIAAALAAAPGGRVAAAGLATQRSNVVCWDRTSGRALSPIISWQDRRAAQWIGQFAAQSDTVHEITGLFPSAHYGAGKLRWCLDHLPAVAAAQRAGRLAYGSMASFLLFRLLEERPLLADPANAARTLLWDLRRRDWSERLLALFGLPRAPLPRCVPSLYGYGTLEGSGVPLALATGDQSAALYAAGAPRRDTLYVTLGTGAFVQRPTGARRARAERLLAGIVLQRGARPTFVLEGTVNGAGSALEWTAGELGLTDWIERLPGWLAEADAPPLFLNGVSGLGTPFLVPELASRFVGAGMDAQKMVAVVESIAFLLGVNIELLQSERPAARIVIGGGLARLDGLCQRLADLTGLPVRRPEEYETTCRGLAHLLARSATGRAPRWPAAGIAARFAPRPNPALAARYRRWRAALSESLGSNQTQSL